MLAPTGICECRNLSSLESATAPTLLTLGGGFSEFAQSMNSFNRELFKEG